MTNDERNKLVESLEEFSEFLKNDPRAMDLPAPWRIYIQEYVHKYVTDENGVEDYNKQDEFETRLAMRQIAKALSPCEKVYDAHSFKLKRNFGIIQYTVATSRAAVCERKVVGTKEVPEYVSPAHTEEIVEWECRDSLLAPDTDD
jgi:hypothetical protein